MTQKILPFNKETWVAEAVEIVRQFAAAHQGEEHLAEEIREWAVNNGLDEPLDGRSWGSVMRISRQNGILTFVGYRLAKSSNNSAKMLWRA